MSDVEIEAITYVFTWRTSRDDRVCQWCDPLDGQVIFFDLFSNVLVSDIGGPVWDLNADHSLLHGASGTCRCTLEVEVEVDWDKIQELHELSELFAKQGINIKWFKERFKLSSTIAQARNQMREFFGDMRELKTEARETNQTLTVYLSLAGRIGDENLTRLITLFQRGRITAEMFTRAMVTLTAASGPWGWLLAGGQFILSGLMLSDMMRIRSPRY